MCAATMPPLGEELKIGHPKGTKTVTGGRASQDMHPQTLQAWSVPIALIGVGAVMVITTCAAEDYDVKEVTIPGPNAGANETTSRRKLLQGVYDQACAPAATNATGDMEDCSYYDDLIMWLDCVNEETVHLCYENAFGVQYDAADRAARHAVMCADRDRFDRMTDCYFHHRSLFLLNLTAYDQDRLLYYTKCRLIRVLNKDQALDSGSQSKPPAIAGEANSTLMTNATRFTQVLPDLAYERACAGSLHTVDWCLTNNRYVNNLMYCLKKQSASDCYRLAYGAEFDVKRPLTDKKLICEDRAKFKAMTACFYSTAGTIVPVLLDQSDDSLSNYALCTFNFLLGWR